MFLKDALRCILFLFKGGEVGGLLVELNGFLEELVPEVGLIRWVCGVRWHEMEPFFEDFAVGDEGLALSGLDELVDAFGGQLDDNAV